MELGEMKNIRQRDMKAHFKDDGERRKCITIWRNLPMAKIPSMRKEPSFPGNATIKDGPSPWIGMLTEMWGFAPCNEVHGKLSSLNIGYWARCSPPIH
jgi:hypothetical protein